MAVFEGNVEGLTWEGDGRFVDARGCVVSVPGTLPGERIEYRVEHVSPHEKRVWGVCSRIVQPSPERVRAKCAQSWPTRGRCGGCPLMHMSSAQQARFKQQVVLESLRLSGINYISDVPFDGGAQPLGYRNRTDLVAFMRQGKPALGAYEPRSHRVLEMRHCSVLRIPLNEVIASCVDVMVSERIPVYEPGRGGRGALRYVSFAANEDGAVHIDFVASSDGGESPEWAWRFANALRKCIRPLKGVSYSLNDSLNNALRTAPSEVIWGEASLPEPCGSTVTRLSASGFSQLNTRMAGTIFQTAAGWIERQAHVVWDLYCGTGCFGRTFRPTHRLYGAEFSGTSIKTAQQLAAGDPWESTFEVIDLEKRWPQNWTRPDTLLLDPPRKGLGNLVRSKLMEMRGCDVLYMSCNPESFARDCAALDPVYEIARIQAFDMMPQTRHVEVLALLKRRGGV